MSEEESPEFCELLYFGAEDRKEAQEYFKKLKEAFEKEHPVEKGTCETEQQERNRSIIASIEDLQNTEKDHEALLESMRKTYCLPIHTLTKMKVPREVKVMEPGK